MNLNEIDDVILLANHYNKTEIFISGDVRKFVLNTFTNTISEEFGMIVQGKSDKHPAISIGGVTMIVIPEFDSESFHIPGIPFPFQGVSKIKNASEMSHPKQYFRPSDDGYTIEVPNNDPKNPLAWDEKKYKWNDPT